ncbi:MAG: hypothetical protein D6815_06990 [Candidatus Dadabacteria bacterium]|nr:MAG: hypothetical protein D6815_06990 [Candidatus Dadabacteria bacterium]
MVVNTRKHPGWHWKTLAVIGLGVLSAASSVRAQTGACCLGDGTCLNTDKAGCATLAGEFLSEGTSCAGAVCTGACCLSGKTCSPDSTRDDCDAASGVFQGLGTTCQQHCASRLGTGFTYQGQLTENGLPTNGTVDLAFSLWTTAKSGDPVGSTVVIEDVPVVNGLFSVGLDFGADALSGSARFLEVAVRHPHDPTDTAPFTTLSPRQALTGTPYAVQTRGLFVDDAGNVGIGTTSPSYPLEVISGETRAINAVNTATSSVTYGVLGKCQSTSGRGMFGLATATSGDAIGVYGRSYSNSGRGVYGLASASHGDTQGVMGRSDSVSGRGVYGLASASTGNTYGVWGESASFTGFGVYGIATASSGIARGVLGRSESTSGMGVEGLAVAGSGDTYGVYAQSFSTSGRGVYGLASASSGLTYGMRGESNSTEGRGVYGLATASSGVTYGVQGQSDSRAGFDFFASGAGTDYGSASSIRWKKNVRPLDAPLDKVARLRGVYFDWDEAHGGHHDVGMIAEEVGEVVPEIVRYEDNGVDAIGMDYSKLTPLLVEAVKELHLIVQQKDAQIADHDRKLAEKDAQIAELAKRLGKLEMRLRQIAHAGTYEKP